MDGRGQGVSFIVDPLAMIFKGSVQIHLPMELVVRAFENGLAPTPEVLHDEEDACLEGFCFIILEAGLTVHEMDAHGHFCIDDHVSNVCIVGNGGNEKWRDGNRLAQLEGAGLGHLISHHLPC